MKNKLNFVSSIFEFARFKIVLIIACLILPAVRVVAQNIFTETTPRDSINFAFSPVLAYTSDEGFVFGGMGSRTDYRNNVLPYWSYFSTKALVTTKGFLELDVHYDKIKTFGSNIRSSFYFYGLRNTEDTYFGIGNDTPFSKHLWDHNYYRLKTVEFGAQYKGRDPLYVVNGWKHRLDVLMLAGSGYEIPYPRTVLNSFNLAPPLGKKGGWVNYIGTGLQWENIDNEFIPTIGNRASISFRLMPHFLLSDYQFGKLNASVTQYLHFFLIRQVVVAARIEWNEIFGNAPFWELPYLGDDMTLRGYPEYRFRGKASLIYNLELRTWLFSIPEYKIRVGGQLFIDSGKIYNNRNDFRNFFLDQKHALGFGGALSLESKDFFIRGDVGFSPDLFRIYAGIGYMF